MKNLLSRNSDLNSKDNLRLECSPYNKKHLADSKPFIKRIMNNLNKTIHAKLKDESPTRRKDIKITNKNKSRHNFAADMPKIRQKEEKTNKKK